jgi:tetratricopeptide (TPR) repeat protein
MSLKKKILTLTLVCNGVGSLVGGAGRDLLPDCPSDLLLAPSQLKRSEALSHFAWGLFLQMQAGGQPDAALPHYQDALRLQPDSRIVFDHLVGPLVEENRLDTLVEALAPLAEDYPRNVRIQQAYAEALMSLKRSDEAIEALRRSLTAYKWREPSLIRQLAVGYWQLGRREEVLVLLKRVLRYREMNQSFSVQHAAAVYYYSMSILPEDQLAGKSQAQWEELALKHAHLAAELVSQVERPLELDGLIQILLHFNAYDDVVGVLRQALSDPEFASLKRRLLLPEVLLKTGKRTEALGLLTELAEIESLPDPAYAELGSLFVESGEITMAVAVYERLLKRHPDRDRLRHGIASFYLHLRKPRKALAVLQDCQTTDSEHSLLQSQAHHQLKDYEKALLLVQAAEKTADEKQRGVDLYLYYANLCEEMGKGDVAIQQARVALSLKPDSPMISNFLGYLLADHGQNLEEAEGLIRKALADEPENVAYLDSLAWVLYRQQESKPALETILKTLRMSSDPDPVILDHAGDICVANHLFLLARRYWLEAVEKHERPEAVRAKLDSLPLIR